MVGYGLFPRQLTLQINASELPPFWYKQEITRDVNLHFTRV